MTRRSRGILSARSGAGLLQAVQCLADNLELAFDRSLRPRVGSIGAVVHGFDEALDIRQQAARISTHRRARATCRWPRGNTDCVRCRIRQDRRGVPGYREEPRRVRSTGRTAPSRRIPPGNQRRSSLVRLHRVPPSRRAVPLHGACRVPQGLPACTGRTAPFLDVIVPVLPRGFLSPACARTSPHPPRLLHRNRLRQVSWLIDVRPLENRHVVGQ